MLVNMTMYDKYNFFRAFSVILISKISNNYVSNIPVVPSLFSSDALFCFYGLKPQNNHIELYYITTIVPKVNNLRKIS